MAAWAPGGKPPSWRPKASPLADALRCRRDVHRFVRTAKDVRRGDPMLETVGQRRLRQARSVIIERLCDDAVAERDRRTAALQFAYDKARRAALRHVEPATVALGREGHEIPCRA